VAAARADLRTADESAKAAALRTKTDAENAAAAHTAALAAANEAATRKCDEEKRAAAAAANAALAAIGKQLDELEVKSRTSDDEHTKALADLKAQYAKDLAKAEAAAAGAAEARFAEQVKALGGQKESAIAAAVRGGLTGNCRRSCCCS
jgi:hypothetical protein